MRNGARCSNFDLTRPLPPPAESHASNQLTSLDLSNTKLHFVYILPPPLCRLNINQLPILTPITKKTLIFYDSIHLTFTTSCKCAANTHLAEPSHLSLFVRSQELEYGMEWIRMGLGRTTLRGMEDSMTFGNSPARLAFIGVGNTILGTMEA